MEALNGVTAIAFLVIGIVKIGWLRRRHHDSLHWIFWLHGVLMLCVAARVSEVDVWLDVVLVVRGLLAFFALLTATSLVALLPRVMTVPSVEDILAKLREVQARSVELQRRVCEYERTNPQKAHRLLDRAIDGVQVDESDDE